MCAGCRVFGIVDGFHLFHLSFRVVGDDKFHRIDYGGYASGTGVQVFAHRTLQQREVVQGIVCGVTDFVNEVADGLRRITTAAETAEGRHTGVIPTVY